MRSLISPFHSDSPETERDACQGSMREEGVWGAVLPPSELVQILLFGLVEGELFPS